MERRPCAEPRPSAGFVGVGGGLAADLLLIERPFVGVVGAFS
jgi:hypothetical protein